MPVSSTSPFAPLPVTDESLLNSFVQSDQLFPAIAALPGGGYVVLWESGANTGGPISLRAQRLDADGNKLGGEILVDDDIGFIRDSVEALAGGGFVIMWHDDRPGDGGALDGSRGIFARLYSSAGVPLGGQIQVNTTFSHKQEAVGIAELTNGNYVAVWYTAGQDISAQLFAADGTKLGGEFNVSSVETSEQARPHVTALDNGGFAVAWEDYSAPPGTLGSDVKARFFDAGGGQTSAEIRVNSVTAGHQAQIQIVTLDNGNVLVAWNDFGGANTDLRAQLLDPAGNKLGAELLVPTTIAGDQNISDMTALAGGGFVVSWSNTDGSAVSPRLQVFAADGSRIGGEIELRPPDDFQSAARLVALADGGFAVGYVSSPNSDFFNLDSFLQVFRADGTPVGDAVPIHANLSGNQSLGAFAIGADGRLLTVWMDGLNQLHDASHPGIDLKYRLFDSAVYSAGDDSAEGLTGSAGIDVIDGRGGDDSIFGLGGNDFLIGGAGADRLDGGAGDDTYYVDDAADAIVEAAGGGNDRAAASVSYALAAGVAVETLEAITASDTAPLTLIGNELANRIAGNAGGNLLDGGAGDDRLEGGAGDDYLVGGLGADRMFGNSGNDTFYVDNAGDVILEAGGDGVDRVAAIASYRLNFGADVQILEAITLGDTIPLELVGNEIGQIVVGNAGDNLIDGGGGRDELIGLGGADTFRFATALVLGNVDNIQDFLPGTDRIALDDAVFSALSAGALPAGAFVTGTAAGDADDRIVYDAAAGRLLYDSDGNGAAAALAFATVTPGLAIAATDFVVI